MNKIFKVISFSLIFGGLLLIGLIYAPILKEEIRYRTLTSKLPIDQKEAVVPQSKEFGLLIPKIGVNAKIFANVDGQNPKEYMPLLAKGVAHAKGSALPGQPGNVFIFAHSSDTPFNVARYNAAFYLISKLNPGDEILVYYQQKEYLYEMVGKKILSLEKLNSFVKNLKGENIILQTCYPPGTIINRLLVMGKRID